MTPARSPESSPSPAGSLKGYLLLGLAFVTCPCHLPCCWRSWPARASSACWASTSGLPFWR